MLGADRQLRPDLFIEDGQHMTRAGYEIWTGITTQPRILLISSRHLAMVGPSATGY
jgi:hypothetical protein